MWGVWRAVQYFVPYQLVFLAFFVLSPVLAIIVIKESKKSIRDVKFVMSVIVLLSAAYLGIYMVINALVWMNY